MELRELILLKHKLMEKLDQDLEKIGLANPDEVEAFRSGHEAGINAFFAYLLSEILDGPEKKKNSPEKAA